MTQRYALTIEYEGTCYYGWQRQDNAGLKTIQSEIEKIGTDKQTIGTALENELKAKVESFEKEKADMAQILQESRIEEIRNGVNNMNCKLCKYREQFLGFENEVGLRQESHHHHVEGIGTGHSHSQGHGHSHDHGVQAIEKWLGCCDCIALKHTCKMTKILRLTILAPKNFAEKVRKSQQNINRDICA